MTLPVAIPNNMCSQTESDLVELATKGNSFAVEVVADNSGKFCGNAMKYPTVEEALSAADNLANRWMLVTKYQVVLRE